MTDRQTLLERLRDMIINGALEPGAKIPEKQLCERFGVSRTPLREALKVLASEGLVTLTPNRGAMVSLLQEYFLTRPVADWVKDLQAVNVPCGPINDLADVFADAQVLARNMYQEMPHPTLGSIKQTGLPIKFSATPGGLDRHPPLLGEHNQEILTSLGYTGDEIGGLQEAEVI